jgi:3-oxoacyl-[acyl-carrier-protein] synthase-3
VALVEALEEGRVAPGALLLLPAFGAGLSFCAHLVRWGERTAPLGRAEVDLPPCDLTGLELVNELRARRARYHAAARAFVEEARAILGGGEG